MTAIAFDVRGLPVAQGTARAFVAGGKARIATDSNRPSSPIGAWRVAIADEARDAITGRPPIAGPVRVELVFRLPRPRSHFLPANGSRPVPVLRIAAPVFVTSKPDADKLARAALDALTGVVFGDDAQVGQLRVTKRYVEAQEGPGVHVAVSPLEEMP